MDINIETRRHWGKNAVRCGLIWVAILFSLAVTFSLGAVQPRTAPAQTTTTLKIVSAASSFLATLSEAERAKCMFAFGSSQRTGWSNLPTGIFQRNGLRLGDMTTRQREAALALVAAALSRDGYQKITNIMNGDEALKNAGGGQTGGRQGAAGGRGRGTPGGRGAPGPIRFGLDEYYIALLGTPSVTTPWMIQFGGHHLAINVTLAGANNVMTPSLPAAQPAKYTLNGQTIRPLGRENDKAFELINALSAEQRKQAILNYQVADLVLGPGADGKVIQPEGIQASLMNASQQAQLLDLAHEWVGILNDEATAAKMTEIKSNLPRTYFAWSGVRRTASWRITASRVRHSSSSMRRSRGISIIFTPSTATLRTTTARGWSSDERTASRGVVCGAGRVADPLRTGTCASTRRIPAGHTSIG